VIIVKVGGSLYDTPELSHWLSTLATYSSQQAVVIVPGGGPFADQVRQAQTLHQIDDDTAHHMAIIAMKQFGLLLLSMMPTCQIISGKELPSAPLSIYLPDDKILSEQSLLKSWDISSDSISLWLANTLHADQLLLIKRATIQTTSISKLISDATIDNGFADLFSQSPVDVKIIHYQAYSDLSDVASNSNDNQSLHLP